MVVCLNEKFEDGFTGSTKITFNAKDPASKKLFIDFQGQEITKVTLNGQHDPQIKFKRHRIYLPNLIAGQNTFECHFKNSYVTNSAGLHFYQDPQDSKVYISSPLEPFFAHRFFPCFD